MSNQIKQHVTEDGLYVSQLDVSKVLEENKKLKQASDSGETNRGESKHLARVDVVTLMNWGKEDFGDALAYTTRMHNDPDVAARFIQRINENKLFKIWKGNVNKNNILSGRSK